MTYLTGTCQLLVELAGPETVAQQPVYVVPDEVRGLAGYVIQQCPGGGDETYDFGGTATGVGGFVTLGLNRLYGVIQRLSLVGNPVPHGDGMKNIRHCKVRLQC